MNRKILAKWKVGSHLYGLNRPESDEDFMGIFMPTADDLLGLKTMEEIDNSTKSSKTQRRNTSEDTDEKLYSLKKFLHLSLQNNPNILEVFFANEKNTLVMTPEFQDLINNRDKIVSQKVYYSFSGYAYTQKKKLMVKKERYTSLVEGVEFLDRVYRYHLGTKHLITEEDAKVLNNKLSYYKGLKNNVESFHKGMNLDMIYSKLVHERDTYGWRIHTDTFKTLGYDVKFGYHLLRILAEGEQLLRLGKLEYPIEGKVKKDILKVRNGKIEYRELLSMYDKYKDKCDKAYENTKLPKNPNFNWSHDWLVNILRKELIKNY